MYNEFAPTADTLFLLVLSILTLESVHSIRFLYQHFLSGITTKTYRPQRTSRQTWEETFCWNRFCFFQWKDQRLLYRITPCDHQPFWMSGNSGLCDRYWKRTRYKTPVFQHHFPGRLADFLCLAGKRTIKPDRKWQDEIYSAVFVLVPVEYWNKLLWAENLLVTLQLYGTKLQGYWNAGKSDQYLLLCNDKGFKTADSSASLLIIKL